MIALESVIAQAEHFVDWAWQQDGRISTMVVFAPQGDTIAMVALPDDKDNAAKALALLRLKLPYFALVMEAWVKELEPDESMPTNGRVKDMPGRGEAVVMMVWEREKGQHRQRQRAITRTPGVERGKLCPTWQERSSSVKEEGRFCAGSHVFPLAN